ncbi:MAG: class I SAM-dependent DNA methyltransferase [Flavobacteriales bacterium]|nr:class I SAM-dependent DNA methyltransferase [Flavobacteriales bacterium]
MPTDPINSFLIYCATHIKGDEKGEAQTFLDRFFTALGHTDGYKGAGATLEHRLYNKRTHSTSFADLVWPKRALIEMKKRGEDLSLHLQQATNYWFKLAGDRPRYVVLCNFTEFWVYDFDTDPDEPQDKVKLEDLAKHKQSFTFLLPRPTVPVFRTNRVDVTDKAARKVSEVFRSMSKRGVPRETAMHYTMQCILAMFAEDVELLPDKIFTRLIAECDAEAGSGPDKCAKSFDLIAGLFRAMNEEGITEAGKYRGVDYFNGGLFQKITPVELTKHEVGMLDAACMHDWSKVNPAIFGSFFEGGMEAGERHAAGAHYTYEIDIKKIVDPVIVQPFQKAIALALEEKAPLDALYKVLALLRAFRVLDPACGSGNFLFVAYREMKKLEKQLLALIRQHSTKAADAKRLREFLEREPYVSTRQFYGMDIKSNAVEVAKVTLMTAKELWCTEHGEDYDREKALPLDNLDANIQCVDALLNTDGTQRAWPEVEAIIGNPPYQSKNKMQQEFGAEYVAKLHTAYPEVPGRADFCVYWFRRAHDHLKEGQRAGLVATNTIRENYSRQGSLDYITANGGVIYNAVSTQDWPGEASLDVSIVSWKKGTFTGQPYLYVQDKNGELYMHEVPVINSSLSIGTDVAGAKVLHCNTEPKCVFQGQTHGHDGFLLDIHTAQKLLAKEARTTEVLKPFLNGEELLSELDAQPARYVIDFAGLDIQAASSFRSLFAHVEKHVLPEREARAAEQESENAALLKVNPKAKVNKHHINFYNHWWQLSWAREDMLLGIASLERYITCSRVASRSIFEFVQSTVHPSDALMVFAFEDDYSFGIIQSDVHWQWWKAKCSTLEARLRYTTNSVWDTFPWPQKPTKKQVEAVAQAAKTLREARTKAMKDHGMSLRDLYRLLEKPGKNPIKDLHAALDKAVLAAYGFDAKKDLLAQLLELNLAVAEHEANGEKVTAPGLPIQ